MTKPTSLIPQQLRNPAFRFYLARDKIPCQIGWQANNNYAYNNLSLALHDGNYGIVCGHGGLIILDFDNLTYFNAIKALLPPTFTVLSATRRLPHLYYLLDDVMFKKTSIRDNNDCTLLDIQASGSGIIGPGSTIQRKYYEIHDDSPINTITLAELKQAIPQFYSQTRSEEPIPESNPLIVQRTIQLLKELGIPCANPTNLLYKCPFHSTIQGKSLHIMPSGSLYCFHTQEHWSPYAFRQSMFLAKKSLLVVKVAL